MWLWSAIASCVGLLVLGVHWKPFAAVLAVEDPGASGWLTALAFSVVPLLAGQLGLWIRERRISAAR